MSETAYSSIEAKSFFAGLFDMKFSSFITPKIARVLYTLFMIVILGQVILIIRWFDEALDVGLGILVGIVYAFVALVLARVFIESILAFFSAVADLRRLAATSDEPNHADEE